MGKKAQREETPADVEELASEYDDEIDDTGDELELDSATGA